MTDAPRGEDTPSRVKSADDTRSVKSEPSSTEPLDPERKAGPSPFAGLLAEAVGTTVPPSADTILRTSEKPNASSRSERRIGPYRILEELGAGGMAVVYKAVQPSLDRLVAVKELRPEYVHDRQIAARFSREASSLASLQHGNIVHIFDYLFDAESAHIVMEFVDGIDLFDLLSATAHLPPEIAASIAAQIADGLEYAHYRGIVHRDIKPSNILLSKRGEVKIMDFGIARDPGHSELTQVGIAVGTPAYMAPEQIRGERVDFRTDIFALGIVLYEMLCGQKPWAEEEGRSVTVKVLEEDHTPLTDHLPDAPPDLVRIVSRCLRKQPDERYRTTHDLRRELEVYVNRAVPLDPRGRLVLYLRNRGLISESEAANFVAPSLFQDGALKRLDQGIPSPPASALLRPMGIASALSFLSVVAAGLLATFVPYGHKVPESTALAAPVEVKKSPNPEPPAPMKAPTPASGAAGRAASVGNEGFLRLVVDPWARVFIDGEFFDLTPFADAIPLSPGRHRLALRNPYFQPQDRHVEIETGKTEILRVSLLPRDEGEEDGDGRR